MSIAQRLALVEEAIHAACQKVGRLRESVGLVAVSKTHPPAMIREAWEAGLRDFGENYVKEWQDKAGACADLTDAGLRWHLIGHLQTNKVRFFAGKAALLHSVDSLHLLSEIERRTPSGVSQDLLLQCSLAGESSKSGVACYDDLLPLVCPAEPWKRLRICGLMTMPPYTEDAEASRPIFALLRAWRDRLEQETKLSLPHLSMGMSHDFSIAIEEGATLIRVGTALFGERESAAPTAM